MMAAEHPDREQVMAWLDGELAGGADAGVRAHLDACADCRAFADELRALSRQLTAWRIEPAPATLDKRVAASLRAPAHDRPARRAWWRRLPPWEISSWNLACAGAAAAILVAVAVASLPQLRRAPAHEAAEPAIAQAAPDAVRPAIEEKGITKMLGSRGAPGSVDLSTGLLVARTASVRLVVSDVDVTRAALARLLAEHRGAIAQLEVSGERPSARIVVATVKVAADQLDASLAGLRSLGRVVDESQASEDVMAQSVDLDARLANARRTEQRLAAVLAKRTGTVGDVLAVEREASRVRGEIEQMEAERKRLTGRVDLATIELRIEEQRRTGFMVPHPSLGSELRNAAADGIRAAVEVAIGVTTLSLRAGPTVVWIAALWWPLKYVWRRRPMAARGSER